MPVDECMKTLLAWLAGLARALPRLPPEASKKCTSRLGESGRGRSRMPVVAKGILLYPEARVVSATGDEDAVSCGFVARVPSETEAGEERVVEVTWGRDMVPSYQCSCRWQESHFTPCKHVYAALLAYLEPVMESVGARIDPSRLRCTKWTCDYLARTREEYELVYVLLPDGLCAAAWYHATKSAELRSVIETLS